MIDGTGSGCLRDMVSVADSCDADNARRSAAGAGSERCWAWSSLRIVVLGLRRLRSSEAARRGGCPAWRLPGADIERP